MKHVQRRQRETWESITLEEHAERTANRDRPLTQAPIQRRRLTDPAAAPDLSGGFSVSAGIGARKRGGQ